MTVRPLVAVGTHRYQRVLMVPWWWNTCQWPGAVRRHSEVRVRPQPGQHHKRAHKRTLIGTTGRWLPSMTRSDQSEPLTSGNALAAG